MTEARGERRTWLTRRGFLIGTGAAGAGLVAGVTLGRPGFHRFVAGRIAQVLEEGMEAPPDDFDAWFEITPDDVVRFNVTKMEMGQGVHTALAQIAADELGARWEQMDVRRANTAFGPQGASTTYGSFSIPASWAPLRKAAATLRELLIAEAGRKLGVAPDRLEAYRGTVRVRAEPSIRLTFGQIVDGVSAWPEPPEDPPLKDAARFEYIGRSVPRIDLRDKLTGVAVYAYDVQRPGMLYGAVARPPRIGSKLLRAAPGRAKYMPGVHAVVIDERAGFAGVAARTREQARRAVSELELEWSEGSHASQDDIEALLVADSDACIAVARRGRGERALGDAPVVAEYFTPFAVHASMEPQAALVDPVTREVFVSAQGLERCQEAVAQILGVETGDVTVHNCYLGGSFGRKTGLDSGTEAARLARATGRPVHVGWTREEEMRHGHLRPAQRNRLSATLENGRIAALSHNIASGPVLFPSFPKVFAIVAGADPGNWVGGLNPYRAIPHSETRVNTVKLTVNTGAWRGLGTLANVFASESFIDELAALAGRDPLRFRLDHLDDSPYGKRIRNTLLTAAELGDYGRPAAKGRARGIALSDYHDTITAAVAEVSVEANGEIVVHRVSGVADLGLVVNPDGAAAQAEGSIVMSLSSALIEELTVKDGVIEAANFDGYPLITQRRMPQIAVRLLESDGRPRGMGEPMMGPVAAAIGNAFFSLTGRRLRRLPFTPERVRAALT